MKIPATIEVNFHGVAFDPKTIKQRTDYNVVLHAVQAGTPDEIVLKSIKHLASEKFPPGMYLYGIVLEEGRGVTADPNQGFHLIQQSADKSYGPALYEVALARLQGKHVEKDPDKGMELMQMAAKLGSQAAQMFLGQAYENGDGTALDYRKSRQYFRLCAAAGDSMCQFRFGKSLLEPFGKPGPRLCAIYCLATVGFGIWQQRSYRYPRSARSCASHLCPNRQRQTAQNPPCSSTLVHIKCGLRRMTLQFHPSPISASPIDQPCGCHYGIRVIPAAPLNW